MEMICIIFFNDPDQLFILQFLSYVSKILTLVNCINPNMIIYVNICKDMKTEYITEL